MIVRKQAFPIPITEAKLQQTAVRLLRLPHLQELRVTLHGLEVVRAVEEDEPVVPASILEDAKGLEPFVPDLELLTRTIPLDALEFDPARHPLTTLIEMMARVDHQRLFATSWFVAQGDGLDAFLGQRKGTVPRALFGVPVSYVKTDLLPEGKLLLFGSSTRLPIDNAYGVMADFGE